MLICELKLLIKFSENILMKLKYQVNFLGTILCFFFVILMYNLIVIEVLFPPLVPHKLSLLAWKTARSSIRSSCIDQVAGVD